MLVGLKVDIFTRSGIAESLPALLTLLNRYQIKASFFPALGPDPNPPKGLLNKWLGKTSDLDIETQYVYLGVEEQQHELGAVVHDVAGWRNQALEEDAEWTREQLQAGVQAFEDLFFTHPRALAVPDFLVNDHTPLLEAELGLDYACDTRGSAPYYPVSDSGTSSCPQLPVTLPTIQDALAAGQDLKQVHQYLFDESTKPAQPGHLFNFTLGSHAHLRVLGKLLELWQTAGWEVVPVRELFQRLKPERIPQHQIQVSRPGEETPGYALQGEALESVPLAKLRDLVYKDSSPLHGNGLFARVPIEAGRYIGTYEGPEAKRDGTYVLWVWDEEGKAPVGRSGRNLLRWLNHHEEGNAEFDGFDLYAKRDIEVGEEITFDYSGGESEAEE